jgi:hypothetical protein
MKSTNDVVRLFPKLESEASGRFGPSCTILVPSNRPKLRDSREALQQPHPWFSYGSMDLRLRKLTMEFL